MYSFRPARHSDLTAIIGLLSDDDLGATREIVSDPPDARYVAALKAIASDGNQLLAVAADQHDRVIGCLQLTFIPGLSRTDRKRADCQRCAWLRPRLRFHRMGYGALRRARLRSSTIDIRQITDGFDPVL